MEEHSRDERLAWEVFLQGLDMTNDKLVDGARKECENPLTLIKKGYICQKFIKYAYISAMYGNDRMSFYLHAYNLRTTIIVFMTLDHSTCNMQNTLIFFLNPTILQVPLAHKKNGRWLQMI